MHSPATSRRAAAFVVAALTLLSTVVLSPSASAATNGRIVFQRGATAYGSVPFNRFGSLQLTDLATSTESLFGGGSQPHYSPDGTKLVFLSDRILNVSAADGYAPQAILVAGGGSLQRGLHPKLSPDATQIVYQDDGKPSRITVTNVACTTGHEYDTSVCNFTQIDPFGTADGLHPAWHPELIVAGSTRTGKIIFVRKTATASEIAVTTVSIATNGVVKALSTATLASSSNADLSYPAYSPDGATIAFGSGGGLYTMRGAGGGVQRIVNDATGLGLSGDHPAWSPDGTHLCFAAGGADGRIYVATISIAADGTATAKDVHAVSGSDGAFNGDEFPSWRAGGAAPSSQADVSVRFLPPPPVTLPIGSVVPYDVLVANAGPDVARGVELVDTLPIGVDFVRAGSSESCALATSTSVVCALGDIAAGPVGATVGTSVRTLRILVRARRQAVMVNRVRVTSASPSDPDAFNNTATATSTAIPRLSLIGLEVTQGIQDLKNGSPLVAGKHTFVRAHVKAADALSDGARITGTLTARDLTSGAVLGTIPNSNLGHSIALRQSPDRGTLDHSLAFEIPYGLFVGEADWTQGPMEFQLSVNDATVLCAEPDGTPDCKAPVTFFARQPLRVKIVSITWTDAIGTTHTPNDDDVFQVANELAGLLPVSSFDFETGSTTTTTNPCGGSAAFVTIRAEIAKLRQNECAGGPCKSVYLGLFADQANCTGAIPPNGLGTFPTPDPDPNLSWGRAAVAFVARNGLIEDPRTATKPIIDFVARAHEISHCSGNYHTLTTNKEPGPDASYTPAGGNISATTEPFTPSTAYGFDVNNVTPSRVYGPSTKDFMSYSRPRWLSVYRHAQLFKFFAPANANAIGARVSMEPTVAAEPIVLVSGQVSTTSETGSLDPLTVPSAPGIAVLPQAGTFAIRFEDATGTPLVSYSFEPYRSTDDDSALVSLTLPWNASARRAVLLHDGRVLASRQASATAPVVQVTSPNGGETLGAGPTAFRWTASDADGDVLTYVVEYSADGGASWKTLAVDWPATTYPVDPGTLRGSTTALLRVTALDGFHATRDQSDATFTVAPHAPAVSISTPEEGHLYVADQRILLSGAARDLEDGALPDASFTWSSGQQGDLGNGARLSLLASSLQEGIHVITLTVRDRGGLTGAKSLRIRVARTRPADVPVALVVPIVLDVDTGAAHFTTELAITNPGTAAVNVSLTYTASLGTGEGSGTVAESVPAGQQVLFPDVIAYLRGRGLAIPSGSGGSQGGTLVVTPSGGSAPIVATARTTTATKAPLTMGSAGLAYGGVPAEAGITGTATIFGLRSTVDDRSNVAVFSSSSDPVTVKVTVISGQGDGKTAVISEGETLPGYGWLQHSRIFDGTGIANGYVTVERVSETGSFGAYGVINDNVTSDGSFVAPLTGSASGDSLTVPVLVETSAFRSELVLTNRGSTAATLVLRYVESLTSATGAGGTVTLALAPGEQRILPEAIDYLRTHGAVIGALDAASYGGSVRVTVTGALLGDVYVGARTAARSAGGGQFGLFTPPVYSGDVSSGAAVIYGLRADDANRSNVAVSHTGAPGSGSIALTLQAYDGSEGGVASGAPLTVTLEPGQWAQPGGFFAASGAHNGYVRITRSAGSAPWLAYGVINDGGQPGSRTGDGAYIAAVP